MKIMRKIIEIDEELCNGCGNCVTDCAEGALKIIDGKAKLVAEVFCDGLGACIGDCPTNALTIVERESEAFDEEAVEVHLAKQAAPAPAPAAEPSPCGCPGTAARTFGPRATIAAHPGAGGAGVSELTQWPVQIHLTSPHMPAFQGADLLVAADCAPVAYPNFHSDFLKGRTVMIGCPKLDDTDAYLKKFTELFQASDIKSVTVLRMEVPCCGGLPYVVRQAMTMAGKDIPYKEVTVGVDGGIR